MDPKTFGDWLSGEIGVMLHVSFWVVVGVVCFVVWRIMEWRYRGVIEGGEARLKLRDDMVQILEAQRTPQSMAEERLPAELPAYEPLTAAETPRLVPEDERVYVPDGVDTNYLKSLFRENTNVQAEKLVAAYLGKWIRAEGEIRNVTGGTGRLSVSTRDIAAADSDPTQLFQGTYFTFRDDFERIEMLRRGDQICAVGRINRVDAFDVELDPAELIKTL